MIRIDGILFFGIGKLEVSSKSSRRRNFGVVIGKRCATRELGKPTRALPTPANGNES
jgi:hypothetical protein